MLYRPITAAAPGFEVRPRTVAFLRGLRQDEVEHPVDHRPGGHIRNDRESVPLELEHVLLEAEPAKLIEDDLPRFRRGLLHGHLDGRLIRCL